MKSGFFFGTWIENFLNTHKQERKKKRKIEGRSIEGSAVEE